MSRVSGPRKASDKIISREEAKARIDRWRSRGKRIVYTNGCFDVLHLGHVRTLEAARQYGDILVVGLNADISARELKGEGRPIFDERERSEMVAALECVDLVIVYPELSSLPLLGELRPHVWVKGGDYSIDTVNQDERAFVESYGGEIALGDHVAGASTTDVVDRVRQLLE